MSTTRQHTIWCSSKGCSEWIMLDESQLGQARKQARRAGWHCSSETGRFGMAAGQDFCPAHAKALKQALAKGAA